jgi:hypothetical protein
MFNRNRRMKNYNQIRFNLGKATRYRFTVTRMKLCLFPAGTLIYKVQHFDRQRKCHLKF